MVLPVISQHLFIRCAQQHKHSCEHQRQFGSLNAPECCSTGKQLMLTPSAALSVCAQGTGICRICFRRPKLTCRWWSAVVDPARAESARRIAQRRSERSVDRRPFERLAKASIEAIAPRRWTVATLDGGGAWTRREARKFTGYLATGIVETTVFKEVSCPIQAKPGGPRIVGNWFSDRGRTVRLFADRGRPPGRPGRSAGTAC